MRTLPLIFCLGLMACKNDDTDSKVDDTGGPDPQADADGDGFRVEEGDCDDGNAAVHPGATEIPCDGIDNDCLDGDLTDADGDGYDCVEQGGDDCDDSEASIHPGADDTCGDGFDMDCDGAEECDCDADGHDGEQCAGDDCDDSDAASYPGAEEQCCDGVDQDCDGDDLLDCDGDGFNGQDCGGNDCDDTDPSIHPSAADACYDGVDQDCGGDDDFDCDGDGYPSAEFGGDDCDDSDDTFHPGADDLCGDGLDQDCDGTTDNADLDGDGYVDEACGGEDCDDGDASVSPVGDETAPDGLDSDCDGGVDEDAYCNLYAPLANGSSALRTYDMNRDGTDYVEDITITSWDPSTGEGIVERELTDTSGAVTVLDEDWVCDAGTVYMTGLDYLMHGTPTFSATYTNPRPLLLPEADMTAGATWSYSYTAADATMGSLWEAQGTYTVIGTDTVTVGAGTFDALVIANDYKVVDLLGMYGFDREVTATMYFVERLGLVYSVEVDTSGATVETRELLSYTGFYL